MVTRFSPALLKMPEGIYLSVSLKDQLHSFIQQQQVSLLSGVRYLLGEPEEARDQAAGNPQYSCLTFSLLLFQVRASTTTTTPFLMTTLPASTAGTSTLPHSSLIAWLPSVWLWLEESIQGCCLGQDEKNWRGKLQEGWVSGPLDSFSKSQLGRGLMFCL